ncbi:hypothetical protein ACGFIY_33445 [Micromonospora chersina]|uniref:hypothetical protein n=1 Tax=Micromonospora chersina TaxID=47854 RepID=UPI003718EC5B
MLSGGNVNDCTRFPHVMAAIRVQRPGPGRPRVRPEHVIADKGYSSRAIRAERAIDRLTSIGASRPPRPTRQRSPSPRYCNGCEPLRTPPRRSMWAYPPTGCAGRSGRVITARRRGSRCPSPPSNRRLASVGGVWWRAGPRMNREHRG